MPCNVTSCKINSSHKVTSLPAVMSLPFNSSRFNTLSDNDLRDNVMSDEFYKNFFLIFIPDFS